MVILWPDVSTAEKSKSAAHQGAGVCFLLAGVVVVVGSIRTAGVAVWGPQLSLWSFVDGLLMAIAGWRTWNLSRFWAVLALVWYVAEKVWGFGLYPTPSINVVLVIVALGLFAGVRGTFAYHRLTKSPHEGHAA